MTRYAVYYAPAPQTALHRFGSAWLGRDAHSGETIALPATNGLAPARVRALTVSPRRYGLHATLKPPFALAPGLGESDVVAAFERFARETRAFDAPPLQLGEIAGFLALVPSRPSAQLDALAARAVCEFEELRAPQEAGERARRSTETLTPRQRELLDGWGYPYVFDQWRFHVTLTDRLDDEGLRAQVRDALAALVAPLCAEPLRIDAVALFVEPQRGEPFRHVARYAFGGV